MQELDAADDLIRRLAGDFAVCMSFLEIDLASGVARYASAGMPPALLFPKGQSLPVELLAAGPYIGRGYKFSDTKPAEREHKISEGDIVVLYSDGITEATNTEGKLFATSGVIAAVESVQSRESRAIRDSVMHACARFSEKAMPDDDQSLIVIQIGEAAAKNRSAEGQVLRESSNEKDRVVVSLLNTEQSGDAVTEFLVKYLQPFALRHGRDSDSMQRIKGAVAEALINCLRHGTPRGKYVEIRIAALPTECIEVELIQTNEWLSWDQMMGRHRRKEIDERIAAFRGGETPDLQYLGTQLVVAHSSEIECSPDGRRQRIRFCGNLSGQ
jgi:anti-sigma regulatory factor (Ser/Thr protein kinase)